MAYDKGKSKGSGNKNYMNCTSKPAMNKGGSVSGPKNSGMPPSSSPAENVGGKYDEK